MGNREQTAIRSNCSNWLACVIACLAFALPNWALVHPGSRNSKAELDFIKAKVKAGAQPWKGGYDKMKSENNYLGHKSKAMAVVKVVAYPSGPDPRWDLTGDAEIVYGCALQWYMTGDEAYAKKGVEILESWVKTFQKFDGPDANLAAGYCWPPFLWGAEILRLYPGWSQESQKTTEGFFRDKILKYVRNAGTGNNWSSWRHSCAIAIAVFLDDKALFDATVTGIKSQITSYIKSSGHSGEICRDLHHVQMGIGPLVNAAEIAWHQGVDLYSVGGDLILKGNEYLVPLILDHSIKRAPAGTCNISDYKRDAIHHYHVTLFHHYTHRMGLKAPQTERMVKKTSPEPFMRYGWGTLTHSQLPGGSKPTVNSTGLRYGYAESMDKQTPSLRPFFDGFGSSYSGNTFSGDQTVRTLNGARVPVGSAHVPPAAGIYVGAERQDVAGPRFGPTESRDTQLPVMR